MSTNSAPMRFWASLVPAPMWGVQETAGWEARPSWILLAQPHVQTGGLDLAGVQSVQQGGLVHVGTPGDVDDHHASFIFARDSASTRGLSPLGAQRTTMSDWESSSSIVTKCMVSHSQPSGLLRWTTDSTFMPRA